MPERWGQKIAGALVALAVGCAPGHKKARQAEPALTTATLGPLTLAAPGVSIDASPSATRLKEERTSLRYGRGQFSHVSYTWIEDALELCPTQNAGPSCGQFWVSTAGAPPPAGRLLAAAEQRELRRSPVLAAPLSWDQFSPGRDAIYAHGHESPSLFRIDEWGQSTELLRDDRLRSSAVFVVEAGEQSFVLTGGPGDLSRGILFELQRDPPRLGASVELPMAPVAWWRRRSSGAAEVESKKLAPLVGAPVGAPLADRKAQDLWALVWVEALPSPASWPAGRPYRRPGRRPIRAKNACSAHDRPLSDRSVERRIHVSRFKGLKLLEDAVVESASNFDPDHDQLDVEVTPRGLSINGSVYGRYGGLISRAKGAPARPAAQAARGIAVQRIEGISFDRASGAGVLLVSEGPSCWRRRFDAEGRFLGPPELLRCPLDAPQYSPPEHRLVRREGGALELYLPGSKEPVVVEHRLDLNSADCGRMLVTSPTTLLLGCSEAVDQERPGILVGLRKLTLR